MHMIKRQHGFALAMIFGFATPAAHAEMITPDSIPNPPAAVGWANGTHVYASNLVSSQYASMGLTFNPSTAITHLNGVSVWAPVGMPYQTSGSYWGNIDYYSRWYEAYFNSFITRQNMTVSSLIVETMGNTGLLSLTALGLNGKPLKISPLVQPNSGSIGETIWRFNGSGIYAFTAVLAPPPVLVSSREPINPAWGIASVSFAPAGQTPEPSSLLLAGLGALGVAMRFGWRRTCGSIA
jgi:hypothetical protein